MPTASQPATTSSAHHISPAGPDSGDRRPPRALPEILPWGPDRLGPGFSSAVIDLGDDPEGEGPITATLVRHDGIDPAGATAVVLWIHGFSDYFFQRHVAERLAAENIALYAIDLRKCGRSLRPGLTPHYSTDLARYDVELDVALDVIAAETDAPLVVTGHSTGGLVAATWLDRRRERGTLPAQLRGLVLNGPWIGFDAHVYTGSTARWAARALDVVIAALARIAPKWALPAKSDETYGSSLAADRGGEFDYERALKPLGGVGIRPGWLAAVRRQQKHLEAGLGLALPVLLLRSTRSSRTDPDRDLILDVRTMERLAPMLSTNVSDTPIEGARHDIFCSSPAVRGRAFDELFAWMADNGITNSTPGTSPAR